ncbi:MAG TPA: Calx-beta domain-containing protein [Steroidobacteraceae bacterium]|jgi:YD repeat-containing protein
MSRWAWHRFRSGFGSLFIVLCCFATPLQAGGPGGVTYTYDDLGRLRTGDLGGGVKIDYQYDAAGNRTAVGSGNTPTVSIGNATSVTEGSSLSFPVTRTGTTTGTVTVKCAPQNGTALAGNGGVAPFDDYVTTRQTVTFLATDPSPTTKNCLIATKTDSYYEGSQTISVVLLDSTAGTVIQPPGIATGTILDATAAPSFAVAGSSNGEGAAITFTITKTGLTELSHNVSYATANGTATTADSDYTAIGTTATTFASTQTSKIVTVATTSDGKYENNETMALNLSAATNGATIGTSSATGTITNNDAAPSIVIDNPVVKNEGTMITFTLTNTGNTSTAFTHSISWATANSTATAGSDYTAGSGTVSFASGDTTKTVSVQSLADGVFEGTNETFFVNLTTNGSTNGAVISDAQGLGTIADIDVPTPTIPTNLRKQSSGGPTSPDYSILWDASTGPVAYYVLDENGATIQLTATVKQYNNKDSGFYVYRVKACSAANSCSNYTSTISKTVCNGTCP